MKHLVLAGGGHAHLFVLEALARRRPRAVKVTLITPSEHQNYSGMLPGWIAGHYRLDQCRIGLRPLAVAAGVDLIVDRLVGIDSTQAQAVLSNGRRIPYDLLSLDVGSETDTSGLEALEDRLLPVKPLDRFFAAWPGIMDEARSRRGYRLVIVGGGAAGVEIALAARYAFDRSHIEARVDLVASESGILADHAPGVRTRIQAFARKAGVLIHPLRGIGTEGGVLLSDGTCLAADRVIAATGARPPAWLRTSGLTLDSGAYIAVDALHRSVSHPTVFAAGDVCARVDTSMARSGVHAVHAGPVLAKNLLASLDGAALQAYRPRAQSLYLLACGPRHAVASWGRWSAEGAWVWQWKDWIDRRFIRRFNKDTSAGA